MLSPAAESQNRAKKDDFEMRSYKLITGILRFQQKMLLTRISSKKLRGKK